MKIIPQLRKASAARGSPYTNQIQGRRMVRQGWRWQTYSRKGGRARYLSSDGGDACAEDEIVNVVPLATISADGRSLSHTVAQDGPEVRFLTHKLLCN